MAKTRSSTPARKAMRMRSLERSKDRKAQRREEDEKRASHNRELRAQGLPTAWEAKTKRSKDRWQKRYWEAVNAGERPKILPRNARGFIINPNGTLRENGNWSKRNRKARYEAIKSGRVSVDLS